MKRFQCMLGVLLLLAYAGTVTAVMPVVVAALAVLDGSHRVMVCRTEQGTQVRLHHREDDYTPEVCDHAGVLGRLVVSLCRPATEGDHSLATSQVPGTLTSPDDEAKRFCKDRQLCSLEPVRFDGRQARAVQQIVFETALRAGCGSREEVLREIATIRLRV